MKACPVCLVECPDDFDYCPIDGIALLPLVDWSDELQVQDDGREVAQAASAA